MSIMVASVLPSVGLLPYTACMLQQRKLALLQAPLIGLGLLASLQSLCGASVALNNLQSLSFGDSSLEENKLFFLTGINDRGDIAGDYSPSPGAMAGFLHTAEGRNQFIAYPGAANTQLEGLNNLQQTVGLYFQRTGPTTGFTSGFAYEAGSYRQFLAPGAATTWLWGINGRGDVVGTVFPAGFPSQALLQVGSVQIAFDVASQSTYGRGVNDLDQVIGAYTLSTSGQAGFLRQPDGSIRTLTVGDSSGSVFLTGINNQGTIVGYYEDGKGNGYGLVSNGDLTLLLSVPGYRDVRLEGINNRNQVVGDAFGQTSLFFSADLQFDPTPEPGTLPVGLGCVVAYVGFRFRREAQRLTQRLQDRGGRPIRHS